MPTTQDFNKLFKNVKKEYLNKPVPRKYQERYGKYYNKKDIESLSYAIARKKGIRIDQPSHI